METIYGFSARTIEGGAASLDAFRDKVLLIVNTASRCGFTGQYAALERLHRKYAAGGFCVLGFPCNQFLGQEPGDDTKIAAFCRLRYEVSFPLFAKIEVNGKAAHPLYAFLKRAQPGILGSRAVKWNFTKFLVDRQGLPVARFAPTVPLPSVETAIKKLL